MHERKSRINTFKSDEIQAEAYLHCLNTKVSKLVISKSVTNHWA